MFEAPLADESIGWPSYVDFLASFAFVLILFVTWSLNLIAGQEREQEVQLGMEQWQRELKRGGFEAVIEGHKLRIPLRNKVVFETNQSELDERGKQFLREAGRLIAAQRGVRLIIVTGYADNVPAPNDAFFNWKISVSRAQSVLQFLYMCTDCGYVREHIRPMLVLTGFGDLESRPLSANEQRFGDSADRRVDIVLDRGDIERE